MVGIGPDGLSSALARVCILDWDGVVLLDTYVGVTEPVTDFRTYVSGVQESDLTSGFAMDVDACRTLVECILDGKILIGHALKNDLDALGITHPWHDVRDTALYAPYMMPCISTVPLIASIAESDCSSTASSSPSLSSSFEIPCKLTAPMTMTFRPRKLKELALETLGMSIQIDGTAHSPVEDAKAALGLYKVARTDWERVMEYKINRFKDVEAEETGFCSASCTSLDDVSLVG